MGVAVRLKILPNNPALDRAHSQILTRLVLEKARGLAPKGRSTRLFEAWRREHRVGFLPEGIPFKVCSLRLVRALNGTFVRGFNQPIILVSDLLDPAERINAARHELKEWQRASKKEDGEGPAHATAAKAENPRLRESALSKANHAIERYKNSRRGI